MRRLLILCVALAFVTGCENNAEREQGLATRALTNNAQSQIGMPAVTKFTERRQLKEIYELRDDAKLICYAYLQSLDGKLHFFTKCMGYGIPYATQFTQPYNNEWQTPQAEPNGLYMPSSADATWLMVPDASGEPHPVYCEPTVVVSPIPIPTAEGNP